MKNSNRLSPTLRVGLPIAIIAATGMVAHAFDSTWIAPGQPLSADKLKADLDEVQSRLIALENQTTPAGVPTGAVLAFNLASCPGGWSPFTPAAGRVLVGASPSLGLGATVGSDSVTLTVAQMPSHSHGVNDPGHAHNPSNANVFLTAGGVNSPGVGLGSAFNYTNLTSTNTTGISIQPTGGGSPFDNRQASLAVQYCIKN